MYYIAHNKTETADFTDRNGNEVTLTTELIWDGKTLGFGNVPKLYNTEAGARKAANKIFINPVAATIKNTDDAI